jgi:hypothetical protein
VPCSSEVVKLSKWSFAYRARGSASSSLKCYLSLHTYCKFFVDINSPFLLLKIDCLEPPSSFLYIFLSLHVVSSNAAGLGTTYEVPSRDKCTGFESSANGRQDLESCNPTVSVFVTTYSHAVTNVHDEN